MSEPRKPIVSAGVSTRTLERAIERLPLLRFPSRLAAIDAELQRRAVEARRERRAA